jgi:predicted PP-loop superfamily ATPase
MEIEIKCTKKGCPGRVGMTPGKGISIMTEEFRMSDAFACPLCGRLHFDDRPARRMGSPKILRLSRTGLITEE